MAIGHDAEEAGAVAAEGLRRLGPDSSINDVANWVDEYFAFWDKHGALIHPAFKAAYANPDLRQWSVNAEMMGAEILAKASVKLRGGRRVPGVDPLVQGLAVQSMMERFWFHWWVAGAPVKESAIAYSIAQMIWACAHARWGSARQVQQAEHQYPKHIDQMPEAAAAFGQLLTGSAR